MPKRKRAYRQGDLDGLCGVYAIVNALRYVLRLRDEHCRKLFAKLIKALDQDCNHLHRTFLQGMYFSQLKRLVAVAGKGGAHSGSNPRLPSTSPAAEAEPAYTTRPVGGVGPGTRTNVRGCCRDYRRDRPLVCDLPGNAKDPLAPGLGWLDIHEAVSLHRSIFPNPLLSRSGRDPAH
jgi:hypothetical protein